MERWDEDAALSLVRKCLPYWDIIDWPDTAATDIGTFVSRGAPGYRVRLHAADKDYLVQEGALIRSTFPGLEIDPRVTLGEMSSHVQTKALAAHEAREPGSWTIAQQGDDLAPAADAPTRRALEFQLVNALPTPRDNVSFPDILEFKDRSSEELAALRAYLDEFYDGVVSSGDVPRAKDAAVRRVEEAVREVEAAYHSAGVAFTRSSARVLVEIAQGALYGTGLVNIGLSLGQGTATGAGLSLLRMVARETPVEGGSRSPLAYIARGTRWGIFPRSG